MKKVFPRKEKFKPFLTVLNGACLHQFSFIVHTEQPRENNSVRGAVYWSGGSRRGPGGEVALRYKPEPRNTCVSLRRHNCDKIRLCLPSKNTVNQKTSKKWQLSWYNLLIIEGPSRRLNLKIVPNCFFSNFSLIAFYTSDLEFRRMCVQEIPTSFDRKKSVRSTPRQEPF